MRKTIGNIQGAMHKLQAEYIIRHNMRPLLTMDAPSTGKQIKAAYDAAVVSGQFPVYGDNSNSCIFGDVCNFEYRFVHDIDHAMNYNSGKGTTSTVNEKYLNCFLCLNIYHVVLNTTGSISQAQMAFFLLYSDTVGQTLNYAKTGNFVADQIAFTRATIANCQGMKYADKGMVSLADQYMTAYCLECGIERF